MRKVMVLEDESSIRSFIVINLRRAGYEVVEAETVIGVANIHARTFPYGVKTFQNLDRVRIVLAFFFFLFFGCHFFHSVKTL
mgnify:CR=1 FL=1